MKEGHQVTNLFEGKGRAAIGKVQRLSSYVASFLISKEILDTIHG